MKGSPARGSAARRNRREPPAPVTPAPTPTRNATQETLGCPLCGEAAGPALTAFGRQLLRCGVCDLLFAPPGAHPSEERCRARYAKHRNRPDDEGYVAFLTPAMEALQARLAVPARILDFGCGPEPVLAGMLQERGFAVSRYDPLFFPAPRPEGPFDAITATEVFEHFQSPGRDIAGVVDLLARRGLLVVMTELVRPGLELASWWYLRDETHVAFYSERTFDWLARFFALERLHSDTRRLVVLRKR